MLHPVASFEGAFSRNAFLLLPRIQPPEPLIASLRVQGSLTESRLDSSGVWYGWGYGIQVRVPQKEVGKRSSITFYVFGTLSTTFRSFFWCFVTFFVTFWLWVLKIRSLRLAKISPKSLKHFPANFDLWRLFADSETGHTPPILALTGYVTAEMPSLPPTHCQREWTETARKTSEITHPPTEHHLKNTVS